MNIAVKISIADFSAGTIGQVDNIAVVAGDLPAAVVVMVGVQWNARLCFSK